MKLLFEYRFCGVGGEIKWLRRGGKKWFAEVVEEDGDDYVF